MIEFGRGGLPQTSDLQELFFLAKHSFVKRCLLLYRTQFWEQRCLYVMILSKHYCFSKRALAAVPQVLVLYCSPFPHTNCYSYILHKIMMVLHQTMKNKEELATSILIGCLSGATGLRHLDLLYVYVLVKARITLLAQRMMRVSMSSAKMMLKMQTRPTMTMGKCVH